MKTKNKKTTKPVEIDESIIGDQLTLKQECFCRNYTQNYEFMGNGTLAYADAYDVDLEILPKDDAVYVFEDGSTTLQSAYEALWRKDDIKNKEYKVKEKSSYDKHYFSCASMASRLLKNVKIQQRIIDLSNEFLNDKVIDKRLKEIAIKGEDKDSINAIKVYNDIKGRIIKRTDLTSGGEKLNIIFDSAFGERENNETTRETEGDSE
jgi:hypothetical protein